MGSGADLVGAAAPRYASPVGLGAAALEPYFFTGSLDFPASIGFDAAGAAAGTVALPAFGASALGTTAGFVVASVAAGVLPDVTFGVSTGFTPAAPGAAAGVAVGAVVVAAAAGAFGVSTGFIDVAPVVAAPAGAAAGVAIGATLGASTGFAAPRLDFPSCAIAGSAKASDTAAADKSSLVLVIVFAVLHSSASRSRHEGIKAADSGEAASASMT